MATGGFVGSGFAEVSAVELGRLFLETGHPLDLTLLSTPSVLLIPHSFGFQFNPGVSANKILDSVSRALTPNNKYRRSLYRHGLSGETGLIRARKIGYCLQNQGDRGFRRLFIAQSL